MAVSVQDIRSTFLEASARFYSLISPPTSAYLMQQKRQNTTSEFSKALTGDTSDACASCATLILPGLNSRRTVNQSKSARRARHEGKAKIINISQQYLKVECLVCHRYTERPLEKPKAQRGTTKTTKGSAIKAIDSCASADTAIARSTPTHKQRKKNRKQGGLQAMLEKSKQASNPSGNFGMDLMDFMKVE